MVSFDSSGRLVDQITGHHGLLELYAHIYASAFLFLVSIISIGVLYYYFKSSIFKYQGLFNGIFYTGLVGLGEAMEHLSLGPTIGSMFHYMHLLAAPIALIFFLLSLEETFSKTPRKSRKVNYKISNAVFFSFLAIIFLLSRFSTATWDEEIEVPLVLISALPTLVLVGVLLEKSKIISEATLTLVSLRVMLLGVSALTISILAGRYGDFTQKAQVYIVFHQLQNISHVVTGTSLLIFVISVSHIERLMASSNSM